jgi:uncharacterized protein (DUF2267 family)
MSMTGLETFDRTVHRTNEWVHELMDELPCRDKHKAYVAMKATLHALRDRLTVDETAQLAAQLPMLVRGFYYEGWDPSDKPIRERHKREFLAHIAREFAEYDSEAVARAVFRVLLRHVSEGEIAAVKHLMPAELQELWS